MEPSVLVIAIFVLGCLAFMAGRSRSVAISQNVGGIRFLNSLPFYYGTLTALWCAIPCFTVLGTWMIFDDLIIRNAVLSSLPADAITAAGDNVGLLLNQIQNIAALSAGMESAPSALNRCRQPAGGPLLVRF